ncbi:MAG TPA: hypothetical protein VFL60_10480 [Gaiellaceae bacterium]|nr:hypothetical protein [Gaiellaceae bacterium]
MARFRSLAVLAAVAAPATVTAARAPQPHVAVRRPALLTAALAADTTAFVRKRTRTAGCALGVTPDRSCSPGAYDTTRTAAVLCAKTFHTGTVRAVTTGLKHRVEAEYGLAPKSYGRTLEIDHIVSLELGGSNDIANLYPELAPGYHVKDVLENKLHALVCAGKMTLRSAQRHIAADWTALYARVFGKPPVTTPTQR